MEDALVVLGVDTIRVLPFVDINNCRVKCSYTIPHKEAGFNCCDEIDPIAKVSSYLFIRWLLFVTVLLVHAITNQDNEVCHM